MRSTRMLFTGLAFLAAQFIGSGATTLTLENPGTLVYQQTANSPCVIGDPSCNQPNGFGETIIPSNSSSYDLTSPVYTVSQITSIVGTTFIVGIDVNTTTHPSATELLDFFGMYVNGTLVASYDPASPGTQLVTNNNGNGYSDELLKTFDLSGFLATDQVTFQAIVNNATDGREEFFLINTTSTPAIPEPTSVVLFGTVLAGVGLWLRKRGAVNV